MMNLMTTPLTLPELTAVFLGIVLSLGSAVVWMVWELDQRANLPAKVLARVRPDKNGPGGRRR